MLSDLAGALSHEEEAVAPGEREGPLMMKETKRGGVQLQEGMSGRANLQNSQEGVLPAVPHHRDLLPRAERSKALILQKLVHVLNILHSHCYQWNYLQCTE